MQAPGGTGGANTSSDSVVISADALVSGSNAGGAGRSEDRFYQSGLGGGGAGGYSGTGGIGASSSSDGGSGSGGGGGGGGSSITGTGRYGGYGGGTDIFGQGSSGSAATGFNGDDGGTGSLVSNTNGFGGGAGAPAGSNALGFQIVGLAGRSGAVRIIVPGRKRLFPSTNTTN